MGDTVQTPRDTRTCNTCSYASTESAIACLLTLVCVMCTCCQVRNATADRGTRSPRQEHLYEGRIKGYLVLRLFKKRTVVGDVLWVEHGVVQRRDSTTSSDACLYPATKLLWACV